MGRASGILFSRLQLAEDGVAPSYRTAATTFESACRVAGWEIARGCRTGTERFDRTSVESVQQSDDAGGSGSGSENMETKFAHVLLVCMKVGKVDVDMRAEGG